MNKFSMIIHGGCEDYDLTDPLQQENYHQKQAALTKILNDGWSLLESNTPGLDVVEAVVNQLELTPCFNAGLGGSIDDERQVQLDASIMRGDSLAAGAIAKLKYIPQAVSVARKVMEDTGQVFLAGEGAQRFAELYSQFHKRPMEDFYTDLQWQRWAEEPTPYYQKPNRSTVGCVVKDQSGLIVAATSTGGLTRNRYGRVGDSPIIGAGVYADNQLGGASATGYGEQILRKVLCKTSLDRMHYLNLDPMAACSAAAQDLAQLPYGEGCLILIAPNGDVGFGGTPGWLPRAYMTSDQKEPKVEMEWQG